MYIKFSVIWDPKAFKIEINVCTTLQNLAS